MIYPEFNEKLRKVYRTYSESAKNPSVKTVNGFDANTQLALDEGMLFTQFAKELHKQYASSLGEKAHVVILMKAFDGCSINSYEEIEKKYSTYSEVYLAVKDAETNP